MNTRKRLGDHGEQLAAEHVLARGFTVLAKQLRTPFGEIDLVCRDGDEVVFVEVKTRQQSTDVFPEEAVTKAKLSHMVRCAQWYLDAHPKATAWRMDVIAIAVSGEKTDIQHFEAIDIPEEFW